MPQHIRRSLSRDTKQRIVEGLGVAAAIVIVALLVSVAGQAPKSEGPAAVKTSWGAPDLQGIWTDPYQTPMQRPKKWAGKEFITDDERAGLDKARTVQPGFGERRAKRGSENDVAGAYDSSVYATRKPTGRRTSMIIDPPDGRMPPYTEAVQKRNQILHQFYLGTVAASITCKEKQRGCQDGTYDPKAPHRNDPHPFYPATFGPPVAPIGGYINRSDGPEDRGPWERCMAANLPDFGGYRRIVQSPESVSMVYDTGQGQSWHRTIPISGNPHLPPSVRQWWGDSRGHWEGNTLVVDVTNFSLKTEFRYARENLHLVERWTRTGPNTLEYIVTIDDPTTWTKPWTVKQELVKQSDHDNRVYAEPRCHEGNSAMIGLLAGERRIERDYAAGKGPNPATFNSVITVNAALSDEDLAAPE